MGGLSRHLLSSRATTPSFFFFLLLLLRHRHSSPRSSPFHRHQHPPHAPMAAEKAEIYEPVSSLPPPPPPGYSTEIPDGPKEDSLELIALSDPVASKAHTYVVQFPKDQIYRVPPPENAKLVDQYRAKTKSRQGSPPCLTCLKWTLAIALLVGGLVSIFAGIYFAIVRPATPQFTIESLAVKNATVAKKHPAKTEFDFTMAVRNPSNRMSYSYGRGGRATLWHMGKRLAAGKTPVFAQTYKNTAKINLVLRGTGASISKLAGKDKKKSKKPLLVVVKAKFPANPDVAGVKQETKSLEVTCQVQVLGVMEKKPRVTSQECKSKLER